MLLRLFLVLALASSRSACAQPSVGADVSLFNVHWSTPTVEPGRTQGGLATYQGGMPVGNGRLTALVWANVSAGGFGAFFSHAEAHSSFTEIWKLGLHLWDICLHPLQPCFKTNHWRH